MVINYTWAQRTLCVDMHTDARTMYYFERQSLGERGAAGADGCITGQNFVVKGVPAHTYVYVCMQLEKGNP